FALFICIYEIFVVPLYRILGSSSNSPKSGVKRSVTQEKSPPYHPLITPKSPGNHPLYHKQKCVFVSKWYENDTRKATARFLRGFFCVLSKEFDRI
ncbi:MAG: hypothetical protein IJ204_09550, partial [Paludibacteraceae bacterium]|nr:hypothetical protein [Paludibacteraceae bacterium]